MDDPRASLGPLRGDLRASRGLRAALLPQPWTFECAGKEGVKEGEEAGAILAGGRADIGVAARGRCRRGVPGKLLAAATPSVTSIQRQSLSNYWHSYTFAPRFVIFAFMHVDSLARRSFTVRRTRADSPALSLPTCSDQSFSFALCTAPFISARH